ncbi:MAG TPA: cytochrome c, partial [Terriglobia bacterium]|nr:cytochrome c [Terriglobia bacterium]
MRYGSILVLLVIAAPIAMGQTPSAAVTFNKDVLPILQKNCQGCHRPGQIAPMSLLTYKEARPWAKALKDAVVTRAMPPWFADPNYGHFLNERSLKQTEIDTIAKWVDAGAPEGEA